MKCIECGHELKDGAIFCIRCGAMQVSMDGKPLESEQSWPEVEPQAGAAGFRSSTDGALHAAQSKNPRTFKQPPKRNGGRIALIIVIAVIVIAAIAFAVSSLGGASTSGSSSSASSAATSSSSASASSSAASSASSAAASASSESASASSASDASSAAAASSSAESQQAAPEPEPEPAPAPEPAPEPEPAPAPASYNDYYVLPDSDSYYYSYDELDSMSTYDLYLARNEIYARHGRMFNNSDLQDYFNSQEWYEPLYTASTFDSMPEQLSDVELQNAKLMRQVEADRNSPYL